MGLSVSGVLESVPAVTLPEPEEIFLHWLISQPNWTEFSAAADLELQRLARYRGSHPGPAKLAALFTTFRAELVRRTDAGLQ